MTFFEHRRELGGINWSMSPITVFGATGAQGGSVVHQLLQDSRWKVRGITRDVYSEKSKQLASLVRFPVFWFALRHYLKDRSEPSWLTSYSQGVEVVAADLFDV